MGCSKNSINHNKPNLSQLILIFDFERYAKKFWKMAIWGCNCNMNFGQPLALSSSLCNTLKTKFHAWTESSVIVEFMVKFIWQHNLSWGLMALSKCPLEDWIFGAFKRAKNEIPLVTSKLKVSEVSQSGFWNISSHPTFVPSFSQIGWPQFLAPETLSQTMTLKFRLILQGGGGFPVFVLRIYPNSKFHISAHIWDNREIVLAFNLPWILVVWNVAVPAQSCKTDLLRHQLLTTCTSHLMAHFYGFHQFIQTICFPKLKCV